MKKLLLFFIVSGLFMPVFSQDLVILKDGQKFKDCKIIKVDSANVYFKFEKNDRTINTFITKDKVMTYQYNYRNQHYPVNNYNYRSLFRHNLENLLCNLLGKNKARRNQRCGH